MKDFIKIIATAGVILMLCYFYRYQEKKENNYNGDYTTEQHEPENSEEKIIALGQKFSGKIYYNYETRYGTSIIFSIWDRKKNGNCTFQEGNILHGGECRFKYTFVLEGNQIDAKFKECDCEGRTTTDRTFYYDEQRDVFSTMVNGETFEFAQEGSPYLKRGRSNMVSISESAQETQSNTDESESGYTTGRDGKVYENAACSLCNGTGIEKSTNSMGSDRICPQCEGTGHQHY